VQTAAVNEILFKLQYSRYAVIRSLGGHRIPTGGENLYGYARSSIRGKICLLGYLRAVGRYPSDVEAADYELASDGNAVARLIASSAISSAGFDSSLITSEYTGWSLS
jgi:hypothetical protein